MNICFFSEEWPGKNDAGGIGFHYQNLAHYFSGCGHRVTVFYNGDETFQEKKIDVIGVRTLLLKNNYLKFFYNRFPLRPIRFFLLKIMPELFSVLEWNFLALLNYLIFSKSRKIDIIETHDYHSTPLLSFIGKKTILVINFQGWKRLTSELNQEWGSLETKILDLLERIFIKRGNYYYANSYITANKASAYFNKKINYVIHNSVDTDFFQPGTSTSIHQYILFTGRFEKRKGVLYLLAAYKNLFGKIKDVPFLYFVGDDSQKYLFKNKWLGFREYVEKNTPLNIRKQIKFINHQDRLKLRKYFQESLFCVFPSTFEPFGNVIAEAMSCGKSILVTKNSGISEIIDNNKDGYIVNDPKKDLFQVLQKLIKEKEQLVLTGKKARIKVEKKLSIEQIGYQTKKLYEYFSRYSNN